MLLWVMLTGVDEVLPNPCGMLLVFGPRAYRKFDASYGVHCRWY
jgi:hypothetical protein